MNPTKDKPSHRVLIVDDDRDTREVLRDLLSLRGFDVRTASNGFAAFRQVQLGDEAPCLLLLDLKMPVMDGWSLLDQLPQLPKLKSTKVVLMSGQRIARRIEGSHMLSKPFRLEHLASFVRAIEASCPVCAAI